MNANSKEENGQNKSTPLGRQDLWTQLGYAINMRSSIDQVLWTVFGTFWATNAILLVALFTTGDVPSNPKVGLVVAVLGLSLSVIWHLVQNRALGHLVLFETIISRVEKTLRIDPDFAVSHDINRADYCRFLERGPRARTLMALCSKIVFFLWTAAFLFFLFKELN